MEKDKELLEAFRKFLDKNQYEMRDSYFLELDIKCFLKSEEYALVTQLEE